jgi:hypothetical protein
VTALIASAAKPKPMNATQLKHLKEKIEIIKRDLRRKFVPKSPDKPPEVIAAEQLFRDWERKSWEENRRIRAVVEDQIDTAGLNIIESLLFPNAEGNPLELLKQLENWTPPTRAIAPAKTRGKK